MTAIQAIKDALQSIDREQAEYIEDGNVKTEFRYQYQEAEKQKIALQKSLAYLKERSFYVKE